MPNYKPKACVVCEKEFTPASGIAKTCGPKCRTKKNRKIIREYMAKWRAANPGEARARSRAWREANRDKLLAQQRASRARKVKVVKVVVNRNSGSVSFIGAKTQPAESGIAALRAAGMI